MSAVPTVTPKIALEAIDELILRLVGGDESVHVSVIDNREQFDRIASYPNTPHGSLLAAILAFDMKFRKLPDSWSTLIDFINTRPQAEGPMSEADDLKDYRLGDVHFRCSSLDVLIHAVAEEVEAMKLLARLDRAKRIAVSGGWKDNNGRLWQGAADAQEWLSTRLETTALDDYEPEDGEIDLVAGRDKTATFTVTAIPAAAVKPEAITWLWPERIPFKKMTLITGKPDCGKSTVVLDIVARVTRGGNWPDGSKNMLGPRDVLMAVAEDDLNDTVVPRLMVAGADLSRIKFVNRVRVKDFAKEDSTSEIRSLQLSEDIEKLKQAVTANPGIALVAVDTITSFFGDVNTNADKDVRPIMDALSRAFRDCGASFLAVIHHNKKNDVDAVQKILGASSVAGAVRAAWGFSRDPENKEEFYMARVKNNLSKKLGGMKYKMVEKSISDFTAPCVEWLDETEETANEVMDKERDSQGRRDRKQIDLARSFLPVALQKGPRLARELYQEAEAEGISERSLKKAKAELNVHCVQKSDGWWWFAHRDVEQTISAEDIDVL